MSAEPTEAEKQKTLELQQRIDELQRQAGEGSPAGKSYSTSELNTTLKDTPIGKAYSSWQKSTAEAAAKIPAVQAEYDTLVSNPELAAYAKDHPATPYEVRRYSTGVTGFDPGSQPDRARNKADIDVRRDELIFGIARANPSYSIQDIDREYSGRSSNLNPQNVTINYEGTLAARKAGFDVGSGLTIGLPDTFQKDENVRLYERNRAKFDAGFGSTPMKTPDVFQPVEKGIFDIGLKAVKPKGYDPFTGKGYNPITKTVTPQRSRAKAARDQPNSKYSNTDFILGGSDEKSPLPISSAFSMGSQYSTTLFTAPPEPRQLTQEQVDNLSPAEYKQYQDEYKAYSAYYKRSRMDYISSVKELINQSKAQGRTELIITANGQTKAVPISKAYTALIEAERKDQRATISAPTLISLDETLGVGMADMGIKGIGQTKAGSLDYILGRQRQKEKPFFTFGEPFIPISRKGDVVTGITSNKDLVGLDFAKQESSLSVQSSQTRENVDAFTRGIEDASKRASKAGPIGQAVGEAGKALYEIYPSSVNLFEKYVVTPIENQFKQQSQIPRKPLYESQTITGIGTGSVLVAGYEGVVKRDYSKAGESLREGYSGLSKYVGEYGPFSIVGAGVALVAPTPAGGKLSPFKIQKLAIETEKGVSVISRELRFGYGKYSVPLIGSVPGRIVLGSPVKAIKPSMLEPLSPTYRGLEVSTEKAFPRSVLSGEKGLEIVEKAGKLQPGGKNVIKDLDRATQILQFSERKVRQRVQSEFYPKQPSTAILPGKESEVFVEKVIVKLPPVKGATVLKTQIEKSLQPAGEGITTADIDVDFAHLIFGTSRALKRTKSAVEEMRGVAAKDRMFTAEGTKGYVQTAGGPREKFLEILTKKDKTPGPGYPKDDSMIFGTPIGKRTVKIPTAGGGTAKQISLESQLKRQIKSVTSIQGPRTERFRGEGTPDYLKEGMKLSESPTGFRLGPPEARLKDLARLPIGFEQVSRNLEKRGYAKEATELRDITKRLKANFPEVEFIDVFKGREAVEFAENMGSVYSSIGSGAKSAGRSAPQIVLPSFTIGSSSGVRQQRQGETSVSNILNRRTNPSMLSSRSTVSKSVNSYLDRSLAQVSRSSVPRASSRSIRDVRPSRSSIAQVKVSMPNVLKSPARSPGRSSLSMLSFGSFPTVSPSSPAKSSPATPKGSPGISPSPGMAPPYKAPPGKPPANPPPTSPGLPRFPKFDLKMKPVKGIEMIKFKKRRLFYTNPSDPLRAGVILAQGVPELRGKTSKVFVRVDQLLAKSRKRNKWAGLDQPQAGFNPKLLRF